MKFLARTRTPKTEPQYLGCVDSIHRGRINGWVFKKTDKARPLEVSLHVNGTQVTQAYTSVPRPDVAWVHDCHEATGFSLPIPADTVTGRNFSFEVTLVEDPSYSVPPVAELHNQASNILQIPDVLFNAHALQRALLDALRDKTDALIRLNNDPEIRLSQIDPALAQIIIIDGAGGSATSLYRAYALAATLTRLGLSALVFRPEDIPYLPTSDYSACIFVRTAATLEISAFISKLRSANIKTIADFDDLVFRPSLLNAIDGVRFLNAQDREQYSKGMSQYREILRQTDEVWTTTTRLQTEAATVGRVVRVIRNFPLEIARKAALTCTKNFGRPIFAIGYYSGTLTHQADFSVCHEALSDFLDKYPDTELRIVGDFAIDEFPGLAKHPRVRRKPRVPYNEMMHDIAECDVVLAPLVVGDPFCESKSELKYFDAALCYTPIIASATASFAEVIEHKVNGFLAKNSNEWYDILVECYERPRMLKEVSLRAHQEVAWKYSTDLQDAAYRKALIELGVLPTVGRQEAIPPYRSNRQTRPSKRLAILLPDLLVGSGGHRKAMTIAAEYTARGGAAEVLFLSNRTDADLADTVKNHYFPSCGRVRAYNGVPPDADVVLATSWQTAYIVDEWAIPSEKFYFVQDFEPMFNPVNTDYALAYNSYRLPLKIIPFGQWNAQILKREFGKQFSAIDFPVEREIYFPDTAISRTNTILFYARPSQPRRLFELGHHALLKVRKHLPNWDIVYYGEDISDVQSQGIRCIGKMTDLNELRRLYSSARLGLAFSTTNPSLIPFEMLACSLPVVDVKMTDLTPDFDGCKGILHTPPTPNDLAKAVIQLVHRPSALKEMSDAALSWVNCRPTDAEFAHAVLLRLGLLDSPEVIRKK